MMEKDYYVYTAELIIAGVKQFLSENLPLPLTPLHTISLLSIPPDVLIPMLEKSDQVANMIGPVLADYNFGSRVLLEEVMITAKHLFLKQADQEVMNLPGNNAKDEIQELIKKYEF